MGQTNQILYRVVFIQQDKRYEIFAEFISEESLMGFVEVENIVFPGTDKATATSEDESIENIRNEFKDVKRTYIPMHTILRIDEVAHPDAGKIRDMAHSNVSQFPGKTIKVDDKEL